MKRFLSAGLFVISMSVSAVSQGSEESKGDLTLKLNNFKHAQGEVISRLYRKGQNVFGEGFVNIKSNIEEGRVTVVFEDLPYGNYALMVHHDENSNGIVDHNMLNFPKEALGFSNKFRPGPITGMPTFEKLEFAFNDENSNLEISVKKPFALQ